MVSTASLPSLVPLKYEVQPYIQRSQTQKPLWTFLLCLFQTRDLHFQKHPAALVIVLVQNGKGLFWSPCRAGFGRTLSITFGGSRASWIRHPPSGRLKKGETNQSFCGYGWMVPTITWNTAAPNQNAGPDLSSRALSCPLENPFSLHWLWKIQRISDNYYKCLKLSSVNKPLPLPTPRLCPKELESGWEGQGEE